MYVGGRDSFKVAFSAQTMRGAGCPAEVTVYVAQVGGESRIGNRLGTARQNRPSQKGH